MGDNGILLVGDKGFILDNRVYPESIRESSNSIERLPQSPGGHFLEWINACKSGGPTGTHFDYSTALTELVLLGNVALHTGRRVTWDDEKGQVVGDAEANKLLKRPYRKGYTHPAE